MDECPTCNKTIEKLKLLKCKFCEKNCCCLSCLVKHASTHLKSEDSKMNLVNCLKRKQSENLTVHYNFITGGDFKDKTNYDPKYAYENFTKVIEDIFPKQLGSGSFGRVFLVTHNETKDYYALKVIDKRKLLMSYGKLDIIYNEINIHSKLDHENIIKLYNVHEDNESIYIVLEYAENGNLFEMITKEKNGLSEYSAFEYFIQVVNAVYYLHNNNIIHRDIKPENILIGKDNKIKLCDFGWAKELTLENRSTFCGTVEYMAPEIVGSENYDYSVDIWSLGILLYELLYGHSPFKANNTKNVILNIKSHELNYDDEHKSVSKSCKDLIKKLLNNNPQKRYKIKDILEHPFIKKYQDRYVYSLRKKFLNDAYNEGQKIIELKRTNTNYINSKDPKKFKKLNTQIIPSSPKIPNTAKKINLFSKKLNCDISPKKLSSSKQIEILAKFNNSIQNQLEMAKKSIENFSFKNSEHCTFEDFRDGKLNENNDKKEEDDIVIKKTNKNYKHYKSSKVNHYFDNNNKMKTIDEISNNKSSSSKKNNSITEKNEENEFGAIIEGEEQKAALDRLNKAFEKFGKENLNLMNE